MPGLENQRNIEFNFAIQTQVRQQRGSNAWRGFALGPCCAVAGLPASV